MVAPGRAARPGASRAALGDPAEGEKCPFCEGREGRTPPESLALGREIGPPDSPGWQVRVVPNLYPALERQEVVVHAPRHVRSVAELEPAELALVADAWARRAAAAREEGFPYVHALVNEGREAGASRAHSHSQLAWLREPPPAVVEETRDGACGICAHLAREQADGRRVVFERDGLACLAAYAGRLPYELLLAPIRHPEGPGLASPLLPTALGLLGAAVRRLHALEGPLPLNAWLHDGGHWHLELLPRLSRLAGLELGAGIYVNTLAPEEAAERLRRAAAPTRP